MKTTTTTVIEFDSFGIPEKEYQNLKEVMQRAFEGTGLEIIDPKREIDGGFQNKAFLEMVSYVISKLNN